MEIVLIILVVAMILGLGFAVVTMNGQINKLNTSLSERLDKNNESLNSKIEKSNDNVQNSMMKQLSESSKLVSDVSSRLARLDETNKRVVGVADELKTLQTVLTNPKQRGVFGEYYLASVLENILPPGQFELQYKFKDGEVVDAAIFLDKGKVLPVDSKFSLENYNRMAGAKDKAEREIYLKKVRDDLKLRIDETSKYIRPGEKTMDFAFMFIPSEALYYDLLINNVGEGVTKRDLIEYAFRDRKVIIVSPTSMMAYLQTVLQGLRSLQIEKEATQIQAQVAKLGTHIAGFEQYMEKLGNSLGTTVGHYNSASKALQRVDKDVVKIGGGEGTVEVRQLDRPE